MTYSKSSGTDIMVKTPLKAFKNRPLQMSMLHIFMSLIVVSSCCVGTSYAHPEEQSAQENIERRVWEVSFGTTQLFEGWFGETSLNLPVSSATLMLSRQVGERFNLWTIFNLPLVPAQEIQADGSTKLTRSAPAVLFGGSLVLFTEPISKKNKLSADLGIYGGKILKYNGAYFPLSALRFKILKGEDTTIYLGLSASFGVDTLGILYGIGHRF